MLVPHELILRDRNDQRATLRQHLRHIGERLHVIFDMFDHIECRNEIEFGVEFGHA